MRNSLFNENGILNIDEIVANSDSFKKIMEDGIVTDEELKQQADSVLLLLQKLEASCSDEQISLLREAMGELGVLFAAHHYKELQDIDRI